MKTLRSIFGWMFMMTSMLIFSSCELENLKGPGSGGPGGGSGGGGAAAAQPAAPAQKK